MAGRGGDERRLRQRTAGNDSSAEKDPPSNTATAGDAAAIDRALRVLQLVVLLDLLGVAVVVPLITFYADRLDLSPALFGLLGSFYGGAQLLGSPVMGYLSDLVGRRSVLLVSCVGAGAAYLLTGHAWSVAVLFASRIVVGLTKQTASAARAYTSDVVADAERRTVVFAQLQVSMSAAFIVGPIAGSWIAEHHPVAPVWIASLLFAIEAVVIVVMLPGSTSFSAAVAENENDTSRRRKADVLPAAGSSSGSGLRAQAQFCARLFGNATVALLFVMSFLSTFNVVLSRYAIQPVLIKRYGLSLRAKGFALAYLGVISAGANAFLVRPIVARLSTGQALISASLLVGAARAILSLVPNVYMWMAVVPFESIGSAVFGTLLTTAITLSAQRDALGTTLGVKGSVQSLARIAGPLASGILHQTLGFAATDVCIAAVAVVTAGAAWAYSRRVTRADGPPDEPVDNGGGKTKET